MEKVMGDQALRDFEVQMGLGDARDRESDRSYEGTGASGEVEGCRRLGREIRSFSTPLSWLNRAFSPPKRNHPRWLHRPDRCPIGIRLGRRELANLYFSGTTCVFVLHGNVHDLVRVSDEDGSRYCGLNDFLVSQVFGRWDLVLGYDLSRGLRALAADDAERLRAMSQYLVGRWGEPVTWPRDPEKALLGLDAFVERNLLEEPANRKKCRAPVSTTLSF